MNRLIRLSDWCFEPGETVYLWWIRSPWLEPTLRQWRVTVVFKRKSGEYGEVDYPWGLLPWLRVGQAFQDGQPLEQRFYDNIVDLEIIPTAIIHTVPVGSFRIFSEYLFQSQADLAEHCFVVKSVGTDYTTIVVPIIECIRAFLTPNKTLALALLEPNYWERVILRQQVSLDKLTLQFSKDIPHQILKLPLVKHIGRLLYDPSFKAAWSQVYRSRALQAQHCPWNSSIPLKTEFPALQGHLRVKGIAIPKTGVFIVQEILQGIPRNSLPFQEIEFRHPQLRRQQVLARRQATRSHQQSEIEPEQQIETSPKPPSLSLPQQTLPSLEMSLVEPQKIKVTKVAKVVSVIASESSEDSEASASPPKGDTVSLADIGQGGDNPAADFAVQPSPEIYILPEDGLKEFAQAISYLSQEHPEVAVQWHRKIMTQDIPFATVNGISRKYVLVELLFSDTSRCWILEFGRPDDFQISTLILVLPMTDDNALESLLSQLFTNALVATGGWTRGVLERLEQIVPGFRFLLTRHTIIPPEDWGRKLYGKAVEIFRP